MFGIGPLELMAILVVALLVFGPKRIPELARTMGRGLAEFRRASNDLRQSLALDELERDLRRDPAHNQTIHRPDNTDNTDNTEKAEKPAEPSQVRPAHAGDEGDRPGQDNANEAAAGKHPGELPLGDEHDREHHETEQDAVNNDEPAHPADSELGNVPVSATKPTDPRRG